jgi:membrane associated rhomboid family serine protease
MGIYDRDYYREHSHNYLDTVLGEGPVCKFLILANALLFVVPVLLPPPSQAAFYDALVLRADHAAQVWRFVTCLFVHPHLSIWTLVFTLLFLWWLGSDLEQLYGSREFLAFYLLAGVLGSGAFALAAYFGGRPEQPIMGPSGAITAVLVLFAFHFPSYKMLLFWVVPVPIWLMVVAQIAGSVAVDPMAHPGRVAMNLAGAVFGALYYRKQWRLTGLWPTRRREPARTKKLRVYQPEEVREPVSVAAHRDASSVDEHLEAKVDAVLEKMARTGKESLTETEREVLVKASEIYRKKRH